MRHSFASWLAMDGVDLYHIKDLLGHSKLKLTERYSHLSESVLKQAAMRIQKCRMDSRLDKLSLMRDSMRMRYEIETTNIFDKRLAGISDIRDRARVITRFDHIKLGNFGDHKGMGGGLFELRFFFSPGFRVNYTVKGEMVVFLLCGGEKSTQERAIQKA